jgi:hypothetical protein
VRCGCDSNMVYYQSKNGINYWKPIGIFFDVSFRSWGIMAVL